MDISNYLVPFLKSSKEKLILMDKMLDQLTLHQASIQEIKFELYRGAHSLKGQCLFMNYQDLGHMFLVLELFFKKIKDDINTNISPDQMEIVKSVLRDAGNALSQIEKQEKYILTTPDALKKLPQ